MKRGQPKRDWSRIQTDKFTGCRVCGRSGDTERAHITGRVHDEQRGSVRVVAPESIVPLCRDHHRQYDHHQLDLLPYLTTAEQARAVEDLGSIENARIRLCPSEYRKAAA